MQREGDLVLAPRHFVLAVPRGRRFLEEIHRAELLYREARPRLVREPAPQRRNDAADDNSLVTRLELLLRPVPHEEPDRGGDAERKSWILNLQKQPQEDPSARTEDRCVDHALAQPGNLGVHVIAPGLYLRQGGRVE